MKIPLYKIYTDQDDVEAVKAVIERGSWWTEGSEIKEFENTFSEYVGTKYAISFNSGTSALHALMLAYKIGNSDEVIVPSFTFIATANTPLFVGAKPVFADIEKTTYGLDVNDVSEKITGKTKAIMPIHYGGTACKDIKAIKELAQDHKLLLFEDAAESLGAKINGQNVGTFGNASMFSFCGNKVITTGEGGVVVTNSEKIQERLRLVRSHGRELKPYFTSSETLDYVAIGYNWRITTMTAALAMSQMKKLDSVISKRRENAKFLKRLLHDIEEIKGPGFFESFFQVFQMFTIEINDGENARDSLKGFLSKKGITTKVYFSPVHLTRFYRENLGHKNGELPTTERISERVLTLPMYPSLHPKEMKYVAKTIKEFFDNHKPKDLK